MHTSKAKPFFEAVFTHLTSVRWLPLITFSSYVHGNCKPVILCITPSSLRSECFVSTCNKYYRHKTFRSIRKICANFLLFQFLGVITVSMNWFNFKYKTYCGTLQFLNYRSPAIFPWTTSGNIIWFWPFLCDRSYSFSSSENFFNFKTFLLFILGFSPVFPVLWKV